MFQNFQFHFHYRFMSENVFIKTQKLQLCCCPDGLLLKFRVYQAMINACTGSNPTCGDFAFFFLTFFTANWYVCLHVFEMYRLLLSNLRLKIYRIKQRWSVRHYSSGYILQQTVDSISTNQWSKYHKIGQSMLTILFYLGCSCLFVKRTTSNFCLHS